MTVAHTGKECDSVYTLETRNYYKIRYPLFNSYKCEKNEYMPSIFRIAAYLSQIHQPGEDYAQIRERFQNDPRESRWLEQNKQSLQRLQAVAREINHTGDNILRTDAFIFTNGVVSCVLPYMPAFSHHIMMLSNFMLDFPQEKCDEAMEMFGQDGYDFYCTYLPRILGVWPEVLADRALSDEEKAQYTHKACLLVEYIVQRAMFSCCNVHEKAYLAHIKKQVLCYCKWLNEHKIYLPKALQQQVYEFLTLCC